MATSTYFSDKIRPRNGLYAVPRGQSKGEQTIEASNDIEKHVKKTWHKLTRSMTDIYLGGCVDPKMPKPDNNTYFLYISKDEDRERVKSELAKALSSAKRKIRANPLREPEGGLPTIEVRRLPPRGQWNAMKLKEHGLLYLPHPYIVPGERFNEMYNWDSMFVVRGLLESKRFDAAKNLVDNLLYEVEQYGTILNGNRTYYLDDEKSRSQPPLITNKIINIFDNWKHLRHPGKTTDVEWLASAAKSVEKYYEHWTSAPHLHEESSSPELEKSGLSRYASNRGVASGEVKNSEPGHYEGALQLLKKTWKKQQAIGEQDMASLSAENRMERYYLDRFLKVSGDGKKFELSPEFYRGDTAMRESGFDPSGRFGFYNADVMSYLPVCLNSLRLHMETGMTDIYKRLIDCYDKGHPTEESNASAAPKEKQDYQDWNANLQKWTRQSQNTKENINKWLWDDGIEKGVKMREPCYRDRHIDKALRDKYQLPEFRDYNFATALFPLWVGAASQEQANLTIKHIMDKLETEHGLNTSDKATGCQWDSPFLWAPLQVVAVEALERYDHYYEALKLATGYLNMIIKDFNDPKKKPEDRHKLWEKYESISGSSDIRKHVDKGYFTNDVGFAWTNAAVIELRRAIKRLEKKINEERLNETGTGDTDQARINRPVRQEDWARRGVDASGRRQEKSAIGF